MGKYRTDLSIQSSNTPSARDLAYYKVKRNKIFAGMITNVHYTDDDTNQTKDSQNPQVLYDVIALNGHYEGQIFCKVKLANFLGGATNYSERTLRKASFVPNKKALQNQDGDFVYIGFIDGNRHSPLILGCGNQPLDFDKTGATRADAPRFIQEYNGVLQLINKNGEYSLTRKGGKLDDEAKIFEPEEGEDGKTSLFSMDKEGSLLLISNDGSLLNLNANTSEISLIHKDGTQFIIIDDSKIQLTSKGDIAEQSLAHTIDTGEFNAKAVGIASVEGGLLGGKLNINSAGQVALGNSTGELLDLFNQTLIQLQLMNSLLTISLGNLGFPLLAGTNPYPTAFAPITVALATIQAQLLLIKGTL